MSSVPGIVSEEISLSLPTPTEFPAFPYSPPYPIQVDLMRHLYTSIEQKKVTIVESPTGTVREFLVAQMSVPHPRKSGQDS